MRHDSSNSTSNDTLSTTEASNPRPRRRLSMAMLLITAMLAVGLVADRGDDATLAPESISHKSNKSASRANQSFFQTKKSKSSSASGFSRRSRASRPPKVSPTPPPGDQSSTAGLLTQARAITDNFAKGKITQKTAVAQASGVVRVVPQLHNGPNSRACAVLLALRAIFAIFAPFLAGLFNSLLARFGCPVPSPG